MFSIELSSFAKDYFENLKAYLLANFCSKECVKS